MAVSHVGLVFQGDAGYEDQEKRYFDEAKSLMLVARDDKLLAFTVAKGLDSLLNCVFLISHNFMATECQSIWKGHGLRMECVHH